MRAVRGILWSKELKRETKNTFIAVSCKVFTTWRENVTNCKKNKKQNDDSGPEFH